MNRVKKYLIMIIAIFIGMIFCNTNSVNAALLSADYGIGTTHNLPGSILRNYNNVLCIDHTAPLNAYTTYAFVCRNRITIEGNVSTGKRGSNNSQKYTNEANGTLAYLLSSYRSQVGYPMAHSNDVVQQDMWRYISTWKSAVGQKYDGLSSMSMTGGGYNGGSSPRIIAAKDYASKIEKIQNNQLKLIEDKTNKDNIKTKIITINDKEYARIGPFKFEFDGSLKSDSLEVANADGAKISATFVRYDADKKPLYGAQNIKSNKNFYVLIRANKCEEVKNKIKIKAKKEYKVKKATICFLNVAWAQNVVTYTNSEDTKSKEYNYEYDVDMFGNLNVIKVDKDGNHIKLQGVGFIIQNKDTGKYVKKLSNGNITYVDRNQATEFITDDKGEIKIEKLLVGTYVAYETKNPNNNYEIIKDGKQKNVQVNKTAELKIENERKKGNLKVIKVDKDKNEIKLNGVEFIIKDELTGKYVKRDNNGNITYVSKEQATVFVTGANGEKPGEITIENLSVGKYTAYEVKNPDNKYELITDGIGTQVPIDKTEELQIDNQRKKGNLKVIKVDRDNNEVKLNGVKFVIYFNDFEQYVKKDGNGNITYVDNRQDATIFETGADGAAPGEINIDNLLVGTYTAYEVENPDKHYEFITEGKEKEVIVDKTEELQIENTQISIDLSGYVWIDENSSKQSYRNELFNQSNSEYTDDKDILLDGITVRLMREGRKDPVATTTTSELGRYKEDGNNGHGEYLFKEVAMYNENDTEKLDTILDEYYIEFEYDGITYTNVTPKIDLNRGSKASEDLDERVKFNKKFSVIEGANVNPQTDTGLQRLDSNDNTMHDLSYTRDKANYKSTTNHDEACTIVSDTDSAGYDIKEHRILGKTEIRYINLGMQRREQPKNALVKDLDNIRLAINGHQHVYYYDQKTATQDAIRKDPNNNPSGEFNVGVKFENSFTGTYRRAVYEADLYYQDPNNASNNLTAYMTYKIEVLNETTNLKSQIQKIVDYHDSRYTLTSVMGINAQGEKVSLGDLNSVAVKDPNYNNGGYSKTVINIPETFNKIDSQKKMTIYLEFTLNREAVLEIMNGNNTLKNVAEILSYSTFDKDNNIYAGFDTKSVPGDVIPTDRTTFEDDTDIAPTLILEIADARRLSGKVFEDGTTVNANIRQGDGKYLDGETGIKDVKVTLTENSGSGKVYETTTNENGDFTIEGFIPGHYVLTYTWGDETYAVQNYKATVYDKSRYDANISNEQWYKTDVDTRWTDATDNYETRKAIDEQIAKLPIQVGEKITKMDATTPAMDFNVEYDTTTSASSGDKYVYEVKNLDFGIAQRPRQSISVNKRVDGIRVILANGNEIVNTKIEDGKFTNPTEHIVYLSPTLDSNGMLKVELDNEMIQGSKVIIDYVISVENNSEKDYISEEFYKYGIESGTEVEITPTGVYDYLDSELSNTDGSEWIIKSFEEYTQEVGPITVQELRDKISSMSSSTQTDANGNVITHTTSMSKEYEYYKMEQSIVDTWYKEVETTRKQNFSDKIILFNQELTKPLKAGEKNKVSLQTSKVLSSSDEIDLNNRAEITNISRNGGSIPNMVGSEYDNTKFITDAETVVITNATGEDRNYVMPIVIAISTLVILGAGVVLIKKKILTK